MGCKSAGTNQAESSQVNSVWVQLVVWVGYGQRYKHRQELTDSGAVKLGTTEMVGVPMLKNANGGKLVDAADGYQ